MDQRTQETFELAEALRAEPGTDASRWLAAWLGAMDDERWEALVPELKKLAASLHGAYADVAVREDVEGDLLAQTYERWLGQYRDAVADGSARCSLIEFVRRKLRSFLAEGRRKDKRRRDLRAAHLAPSAAAEAESAVEGFAAASHPDPNEVLIAAELAAAAGSDPRLQAVLELKMQGFTQNEIGQRLGVSRPTVSRRLAAVATVITAMLGAAAALFLFWNPRESTEDGLTPRRDAVAQHDEGPGLAPSPDALSGGAAEQAPVAGPVAGRAMEPTMEPPMELTARSPLSPARPGLRPAQVRRVLARARGQLRTCQPRGPFEVSLFIRSHGTVARVELAPADRCLHIALSHLRFPASAQGTYAAVTLEPEGRFSRVRVAAFAAGYELVVERGVRGWVSLVAPESESGSGTFDPSIVTRMVRSRLRAIRTCYERELRNDPTLAGRVLVRFTIGTAGTVGGVTALRDSTGSPAVAACVVNTIRRFRFHPGPEGGSVTFAYAFVFASQN